jgi:pyruvate kinase
VFRLNFSHGTQEDHKKRYDIIRSIEKDVGRPIGVLVDLQGAEATSRHVHHPAA